MFSAFLASILKRKQEICGCLYRFWICWVKEGDPINGRKQATPPEISVVSFRRQLGNPQSLKQKDSEQQLWEGILWTLGSHVLGQLPVCYGKRRVNVLAVLLDMLRKYLMGSTGEILLHLHSGASLGLWESSKTRQQGSCRPSILVGICKLTRRYCPLSEWGISPPPALMQSWAELKWQLLFHSVPVTSNFERQSTNGENVPSSMWSMILLFTGSAYYTAAKNCLP